MSTCIAPQPRNSSQFLEWIRQRGAARDLWADNVFNSRSTAFICGQPCHRVRQLCFSHEFFSRMLSAHSGQDVPASGSQERGVCSKVQVQRGDAVCWYTLSLAS